MYNICVVYAITHLSVPNSCRSGVDVYWTNLSLARIVFRAFNETRSSAARLNQIPKYPKNFWRGESNRVDCEMQIPTGIFSISLFLSFFSLHCVKTWTKYPPHFQNFFVIIFTRSKRDGSLHFYLRTSILQSLQPDARRIFTSTYGSGKYI